ncbi:MAG: peptidoglycan-binding protein [Thermoflavifilum sp.]|nr:peptidoglycan-binding protein [Thermoflavifilum sp.]MCL6514812.1 peptidoglycan-binding protein [Alicyclobacillus sp.]
MADKSKFTRKMVDCATRLTAEAARAFAEAGVQVVGRYLGNWAKSLTPGEVQAIRQAGLDILSFWESNPTHPDYFTPEQAKSDAERAVASAKAIGQPPGSAIYFTVDFDAQDKDLPAIARYVDVLLDTVKEYAVGIYGPKRVVDYLAGRQRRPAYFAQTCAWSGGQLSDHADVYQYETDQRLAGIAVDLDLATADAGTWFVKRETGGMTSRSGSPVPQISQHRTLYLDAVGEDVRLCQRLLYRAGQHPGPIDGAYGSGTMNAVRAFQAANRLTVDGICGPRTWAALESAKQAERPLLERGANGQQVKDLQYLLTFHKCSPGAVDGAFGERMEQAVKAFQKARGLTVDGKVGPQTWGALLAV